MRVDVSRVGPGKAVLFDFERDGEPLTGMVVADGQGGLAVYVNRCPHVPYSLDLGDGNVIDDDGRTIVCSNHGARFDPASGRCIWGPVLGRFLERLPFVREGATAIVVTLADEARGWPETYRPE
ncbi:MAG: Rieske 2Fe-2S domain-containing protein [Myxococcota bacterium]